MVALYVTLYIIASYIVFSLLGKLAIFLHRKAERDIWHRSSLVETLRDMWLCAPIFWFVPLFFIIPDLFVVLGMITFYNKFLDFVLCKR